MDIEKIVEEVRKEAIRAEQQYGGCGQSTLYALKKVLNLPDAVLDSAAAFQAGMAAMGKYACGALCGGVMALSYYRGRKTSDFETYEDVNYRDLMFQNLYLQKFQAEYGGINCSDVQTKIMGRPYNLLKEYMAFLKAGGHDDKCPYVCAFAAETVIRMLAEENLLEGALL